MDKKRPRSPGRLAAERLLKDRLGVAGLCLLVAMGLFSFVGALFVPYTQDQVFYRREPVLKEYAALKKNDSFRFLVTPGQTLEPEPRALFTLKQESFLCQGQTYTVLSRGGEFYDILVGGRLVASACKDTLYGIEDTVTCQNLLRTYAQQGESYDGYTLRGQEIYRGDTRVATVSRYLVTGQDSRETFRQAAMAAAEQQLPDFTLEGRQFHLEYDPVGKYYRILEQTYTRVWDAYSPPGRTHLLGTDKNGMDVLTRLMYGGRVSLTIGFAVVLVSGLLGTLIGGISGYLGGRVDGFLMRLVDVFYCIPATPLLIVLGAAMDGLRVSPQLRIPALILVLGLLSWPELARLVRGQLLSLREREFMVAAEAAGIRPSRRLLVHLLPNVLPQLIVASTGALGSAILTEATLSFLGLGVKFPYASWGNIINDVSNAYVLTAYPFLWVPAGLCLVATVLGFHFAGDGLRQALDPKAGR